MKDLYELKTLQFPPFSIPRNFLAICKEYLQLQIGILCSKIGRECQLDFQRKGVLIFHHNMDLVLKLKHIYPKGSEGTTGAANWWKKYLRGYLLCSIIITF